MRNPDVTVGYSSLLVVFANRTRDLGLTLLSSSCPSIDIPDKKKFLGVTLQIPHRV